MSNGQHYFVIGLGILFSLSSIGFSQTNTMTYQGLWDDIGVVESKHKTTQTSLQQVDLGPSITAQPTKTLYNLDVDTQQVQDTRAGRVNRERSIRGLPTLVVDESLNDTAIERANHLANSQEFTLIHRRPGQSCTNYRCYNPGEWFLERGVSQYASETVLFGGYSGEDSTENLINTLRGRIGGPSGFLGLIIGEMSYNGVHYRMMLNPNIRKIGIGVAPAHHPGFGSAYMAVIHYE